jgi:hypothetical protein
VTMPFCNASSGPFYCANGVDTPCRPVAHMAANAVLSCTRGDNSMIGTTAGRWVGRACADGFVHRQHAHRSDVCEPVLDGGAAADGDPTQKACSTACVIAATLVCIIVLAVLVGLLQRVTFRNEFWEQAQRDPRASILNPMLQSSPMRGGADDDEPAGGSVHRGKFAKENNRYLCPDLGARAYRSVSKFDAWWITQLCTRVFLPHTQRCRYRVRAVWIGWRIPAVWTLSG